jgi:serine/threonine-protein kinase HipA
MSRLIEIATVKLWDHEVGVVAISDSEYAVFEYVPDFLDLGLDIAPITMPLEDARRGDAIYAFPALSRETYKGLPGLLADSLPDKFGQEIINAWLARLGRGPETFSVIERLCYTGTRGMGALEYEPSIKDELNTPVKVDIEKMLELVQDVMQQRSNLSTRISSSDDKNNHEAMIDILRIGTSAGGARAKALIAYNEQTGEVMSGQANAPKGFDHWLLKFDGVTDIELGKTQYFGRIEYAYYKMARAAGIDIAESRLLEENGRAHFMTRRFDRMHGEKTHMQTLCAMAHYDFNMPGAYSYEQALMIMRKLKLPKSDQARLYKRMVFNIVSRNHDDHTKNITFLMDKDGHWSLAPAYDVTHAYAPRGGWTQTHQMTVNGKRDAFTKEDLLAVASAGSINNPEKIIQEVLDVVSQWPTFAREAGLPERHTTIVSKDHRLFGKWVRAR